MAPSRFFTHTNTSILGLFWPLALSLFYQICLDGTMSRFQLQPLTFYRSLAPKNLLNYDFSLVSDIDADFLIRINDLSLSLTTVLSLFDPLSRFLSYR